MKYQHTEQYQLLLHLGLRKIASERKEFDGRHLSDKKIVNNAKLDISRSQLNKFRNEDYYTGITLDEADTSLILGKHKRYLQYEDSIRLWDFLSKHTVIERLFSDQKYGLSKVSLVDSRTFSSDISNFFGCHESQITGRVEQSICGSYFGYKRSSRNEKRIVKSHFRVTDFQEEYLEIEETQLSTGYLEFAEEQFREESRGIGVSKSERLWMFLREQEREQPRILCFDKYLIPSGGVTDSSTPHISMMYGHVMEGNKAFIDGLYVLPIVLVKEADDRRNVEKKFPDYNYKTEDQIDVFEIGGPGKPIDESQYNFADNPIIIEYLNGGKPNL